MDNQASVWTSLEIIKLIVSAATPVIAGIIAWMVGSFGIQLERRKAINQELVKKRIQLYDQIGPLLNDIYVAFMFVGHVKDIKLSDVIQCKREADRIIYVNRPLISKSLFDRYDSFINLVFDHSIKYGEAAKLKLDRERGKREWRNDWQPDWETLISDKPPASSEAIRREYDELVGAFASDIGASQMSEHDSEL
jgi:hypothetical protein